MNEIKKILFFIFFSSLNYKNKISLNFSYSHEPTNCKIRQFNSGYNTLKYLMCQSKFVIYVTL